MNMIVKLLLLLFKSLNILNNKICYPEWEVVLDNRVQKEVNK